MQMTMDLIKVTPSMESYKAFSQFLGTVYKDKVIHHISCKNSQFKLTRKRWVDAKSPRGNIAAYAVMKCNKCGTKVFFKFNIGTGEVEICGEFLGMEVAK